MFANKFIDSPFRPFKLFLLSIFNRVNGRVSLVIKFPFFRRPIKPFHFEYFIRIIAKNTVFRKFNHYFSEIHLRKYISFCPRIGYKTLIVEFFCYFHSFRRPDFEFTGCQLLKLNSIHRDRFGFSLSFVCDFDYLGFISTVLDSFVKCLTDIFVEYT